MKKLIIISIILISIIGCANKTAYNRAMYGWDTVRYHNYRTDGIVYDVKSTAHRSKYRSLCCR